MMAVQQPAAVGTVVLVVDDNEANRYVVSRVLRHAGFTVIEAMTGGEALDLVATERPSLVCLDVKLPDLSGYEVCRRIKADPRTRTVVLHISATFVGREDKIRGLEGGADGYLVSPVQPEELIATVNSFLRIQRAEAQMREAARQWRCTFDTIRDGIALVDAAGRVLRCNRALARLVAQSYDDLRGRLLAEIVRLPTDMVATEEQQTGTVSMGGRWYEATVNQVVDAEGPPMAVWIFTDITQRRASEEEIRSLNAALSQRIDDLQRSRAELQEKIADLEKFEDVVVGREMRMMELEKEVRRLKHKYEPTS